MINMRIDDLKVDLLTLNLVNASVLITKRYLLLNPICRILGKSIRLRVSILVCKLSSSITIRVNTRILVQYLVDAEDQSNGKDGCACFNSLFITVNDSLLVRLYAAICAVQGALIWLGFITNCIFQLIFLPFDQTWGYSFIASCLAIPGIVSL